MARKKISQVEALNWKHRALRLEKEIEEQRYAWANAWGPGGVDIGRTDELGPELTAAIRTARKLKHAVVAATTQGSALAAITFMATPLPKSRV